MCEVGLSRCLIIETTKRTAMTMTMCDVRERMETEEERHPDRSVIARFDDNNRKTLRIERRRLP